MPSLYDIFQQKCVKNKIPITVDFELTRKCNLQCKHCYMVGEDREELSSSEINRILDQLIDMGTFYLLLTGGEIFMRQDIMEILHHIEKNRFVVTIFTNGTLITPEIADKIHRLKPASVEISLYGANPVIHEKVTGIKGSYKATMRTFQLLKQRSVPITLKTSLMSINLKELEGLIDLAKNLDIHYHLDPTLIPKTNGSLGPLQFSISDEDFRRLDFAQTTGEVKLSDSSSFFPSDLLQEKIESGVRVICNAGKNNCAISAYGDVFPCIALPIRMGNLQEQSFKAIWQTTSIDEIRYMTVSDLPTCSKCELLRWCVRCPGAAYLETDNFHNPSSEACRRAGIYYEREQSLLKKGGGEWTTTRSSTANRK